MGHSIDNHKLICTLLINDNNIFVLQQNNSLIESVKKRDFSGVKDALLRGADVNATDQVSPFIIKI